MRRTKASGSGSSSDDMGAKNMSYTNLAAMATEFELAPRRHVLAISASAGGAGASGADSSEVLHQKAMELIQMGLKLDLNNPLQASEYYQSGADLLSQALETAQPDKSTDEMQRTLDMVEERVRFLTREAVSRSASDSQITTSLPIAPVSPHFDVTLAETAVGEQRASNYFDLGRPQTQPAEIREAMAVFGTLFEQLVRIFGFQQESAYNQQEHLAMLLANFSSRETSGAPGRRARRRRRRRRCVRPQLREVAAA